VILSLKSILGQNAPVPSVDEAPAENAAIEPRIPSAVLPSSSLSPPSSSSGAAVATTAIGGGGGGRAPMSYQGHVVAELRDNDNKPIIEVSGGSLVELVVVHDIIGRMLAKATVQPNIRRIYDDLLGFDGRPLELTRACTRLVEVLFSIQQERPRALLLSVLISFELIPALFYFYVQTILSSCAGVGT